jgi:hypothetical protein
VATLKANVFVGYNLGHNYFKMGFLCLIGIAHLPETMTHLKFSKEFEFRCSLTTDIGKSVEEELIAKLPKQAHKVTKNLFCAIRTVSAHILPRVPISGNIVYQEQLQQKSVDPFTRRDDSDDETQNT